jgi:hypothetical protein
MSSLYKPQTLLHDCKMNRTLTPAGWEIISKLEPCPKKISCHPTLEHTATVNHPAVVAGRGSFCQEPVLEGVLHQETSHGGGGGLLEGGLHQETSHGGDGGLLEGVLHQETSHGGVFCTKRPAMVVLGAYLRVFCTKRPAMVVVGGLLEGVLHQETSHGGPRGCTKWVWLQKRETQELPL